MPSINIAIANQQRQLPVDEDRLQQVVAAILQDAGLRRAEVSVAVVDDAAIQQLHERYLQIDEPTDVLSFVLEQGNQCLEGEVIVSAETAIATARTYGWPAEDELLLYVIHGTLHLVGYDDTVPEKQEHMRQHERSYLARLGIEGRFEQTPHGPSRPGEPAKEPP